MQEGVSGSAVAPDDFIPDALFHQVSLRDPSKAEEGQIQLTHNEPFKSEAVEIRKGLNVHCEVMRASGRACLDNCGWLSVGCHLEGEREIRG